MTEPNILDDLRRFMRTLDIPKPRELHCGRAAWDVLRNVSDKTTDVLGLTAAHLPATGLYGVPVHIDPEMPDAGWKLTEDGETVASGDMAPGHRHAAYVPGVGLVAFPDDSPLLGDN